MVLVMANKQEQNSIDRGINWSNNFIKNTERQNKTSGSQDDSDIRSVSMSANIASSVCQEVNHLIHVNTVFSLEDTSKLQKDANAIYFTESPELDSVCSAVLPAVANVLVSVVLSRWDDIVGPQTIHMWIQKSDSNEIAVNNVSTYQEDIEKRRDITSVVKAVHYVTCHTVNCTSVSATSGASSMFIVPDLNMISVAHLFHSFQGTVSTPFSVAILASSNQYTFLQQKYEVIQQWLKRFVHRLKPVLEKWQTAAEIQLDNEVDDWVLDLNCAVNTMNEACLEAFQLDKFCNKVLKHPALPEALTSHLQTFDFSVIIGTSTSEVNLVIIFLSLFLEENEKSCSRLIPQSTQCCFNLGLYLQGLILNGFGYREISSSELTANQYPVTIVDLTRSAEDGAVKQTLLYHQHIAFHQHSSILGDTDSLTKSLLHPVKESSKLVNSLLKELALLPVSSWKKLINNFKKKIASFAQMLISLMHQSSVAMCQNNTKNTIVQQFKKNLGLGEADFLIILAEGEKIKPGLFCYVMRFVPS